MQMKNVNNLKLLNVDKTRKTRIWTIIILYYKNQYSKSLLTSRNVRNILRYFNLFLLNETLF